MSELTYLINRHNLDILIRYEIKALNDSNYILRRRLSRFGSNSKAGSLSQTHEYGQSVAIMIHNDIFDARATASMRES